MKGGLGNIMKQAQKMQEEMQKAQAQMADVEVIGEAGGAMVKVAMKGTHEVMRVNIDAALMADDKEMLEDLIAAAVNDAVHKVAKQNKDSMANMTAGLNLPPGFKLPF